MSKILYRYTTKLDLAYSIYTLNTQGATLGYVMLGFRALASGKAERSTSFYHTISSTI